MLHKLSKYLVGIGTFLFVAMFPVGELYAQYNLETITNKELFAYPPKSSLRATRWVRKADKFKAEGNVEKAVLYYTKAAEKGDARAQFIMSLCYNDGYGVDPDEERSMYWLNLSLEQEYALAQNFRGVVYTYHKENSDYKKALAYYKKAALQGYSEAQYNVGWCYFNGYGVEADQEEAMRWIRMAAEQEYALALDAMWQGYYFGTKGLPRDYKQAADWMEKAIAKGEQMPQFYLATLYLEGKGVEADTVKALSLFTQSAEEGYMWSQNMLGSLYEVGIGVPADSAAAYAWYKKAAEQGLADAQNNVGRCYRIGIGVEETPALAVEWYQRASKNGNVYAMSNLGWCYEQGYGIDKNHAYAFRYYKEAADHHYAEAYLGMGRLYWKGIGVKRDYTEAGICLHRAAGAGVTAAYEELGRFYESDSTGFRNDKESFDWYMLAADKGSSYATWRLGRFYQLGRGVEQDYGKAIEYLSRASHTRKTALVNLGDCYKETEAYDRAFDCYERAYEQGQENAACCIAIMYEKGLGVAVDNDEAMKWYTLGAEAGARYAKYHLGRRYHMGDIVPAYTFLAIEWLSRSCNNGYATAWWQLGVSYTTGKYLPRNYQKAFACYYRAAHLGDVYSAFALGECYR